MKKLNLYSRRFLIIIFLLLIACNSYAFDRKPLSEQKLKKLVVGNTLIGLTCHSKSIYVLYFYPDGRLYFQKNVNPKQTYVGKWWVKGDRIYSNWPTYKDHTNRLRYYHINGNVYEPFNINDACGPAGTFGHPFVVLKRAPGVNESA